MANMKVILLERIPRLGQMGDEVSVKPGYARNFLLPQGKALRANKANREHFESQRADLEARNLDSKKEAEAIETKLSGKSFVIIRQAGETGQLYGSVATRDIADALIEEGFTVNKNQILLAAPIKVLGLVDVKVRLHPEVETNIQINVARTDEEAERQAKGEDITMLEEDDVERDFDGRTADDFFEEEAQRPEGGEKQEDGEEAESAEAKEAAETEES